VGHHRTILIAEDNEHDVLIYQRAFGKVGKYDLHFVSDGAEAIDYLKGEGKYADRHTHPFPECLWLDVKMPRMTGLEVLRWLKEHPKCAITPTVVLSSSDLLSDVQEAYRLGAHSFFTKPSSLNETVDLVALVNHYWTVCLTPELATAGHCE
jgi:CheY-like chemotaxis protein